MTMVVSLLFLSVKKRLDPASIFIFFSITTNPSLLLLPSTSAPGVLTLYHHHYCYTIESRRKVDDEWLPSAATMHHQ